LDVLAWLQILLAVPRHFSQDERSHFHVKLEHKDMALVLEGLVLTSLTAKQMPGSTGKIEGLSMPVNNSIQTWLNVGKIKKRTAQINHRKN
jgi:hypothetical protein